MIIIYLPQMLKIKKLSKDYWNLTHNYYLKIALNRFLTRLYKNEALRIK